MENKFKTTKDLLVFGKSRIEQYGWIQHRFGTKAVGFCMAGSMIPDGGRVSEFANAADQCLRKVIGENSIGKWNDMPGRTKEEVLEAFDKAIALAEKEG